MLHYTPKLKKVNTFCKNRQTCGACKRLREAAGNGFATETGKARRQTRFLCRCRTQKGTLFQASLLSFCGEGCPQTLFCLCVAVTIFANGSEKSVRFDGFAAGEHDHFYRVDREVVGTDGKGFVQRAARKHFEPADVFLHKSLLNKLRQRDSSPASKCAERVSMLTMPRLLP